MKTVHVVLNAHLDPVWLWSWRDGLDEVLNTSASLCGFLDRNPDAVYTRGEAWLYEQVRLLDPALFRRIVRHVRAGRWSPVGGWYIQPDCNQPSGFALRRQIALGKEWFLRHFGHFPRTAYNVDSFGHAATLPALMREAGQRHYVMMRPQEHEMALPARLFRWRGFAGGPEVTAFRVAKAYCTPDGELEEHLRASLTELPEGVSHTMCFVGVGDHGGGPTQEMVDWLRSRRDAFPGVRLVFSSPERFFRAVSREAGRLPLVVGELQHHAVGCYSVHRPVKTALRRAEHRLIQAELAQKGRPSAAARRALRTGWERVCFHHFHDTLGGTCLPSAYADVDAQLGQALAIADEEAARALRRRVVALPPDPRQRLVFLNASEAPHDDFVEVEPWLEWTKWRPEWRLLDEKGKAIPHQVVAAESAGEAESRLLFPLRARPGALRVVRIAEGGKEGMAPSPFSSGREAVAAEGGPALDLRRGALTLPGLPELPLPALALCDDPTDTWSHGVDRYGRQGAASARWGPARLLDRGPLMASLVQRGRIGASKVQAEWRLYRGRPWIELRLRVVWTEERRLLKLDWTLPKISRREDGIPGGSLERAADGKELPLRDWTRLRWKGGGAAVVAPEVYAADATATRLGLTLLRSCVLACHEPNPGTHPRSVFSDRGEHFFRFRFLPAAAASAARLDAMALALHRPLLSATTTRGMRARALRGRYLPGPGSAG